MLRAEDPRLARVPAMHGGNRLFGIRTTVVGDDVGAVEFFQWHSDGFDLPPDARRLLSSAWCANQAYIIPRDGFAHVGMQFHIEMTPELVRRWVDDPKAAEEGDAERLRTGGPAVQTPAQMLQQLEGRTARMLRVAQRLYDRWLQGVRDAGRR